MAHEAVFQRLKQILAPYAGRLAVTADEPALFELSLPPTVAGGRAMFVAAVRDGKGYASFHLMPVYGIPGLLSDASPDLLKRMQGKSCFSFTRVDEPLLAELAAITERGITRFGELGEAGLRERARAAKAD